jgi:hypothetical protein
VQVGDRFVFLWEAPGKHPLRWSAGYASTPIAKRPQQPAWLGHGLDLTTARQLAESWASHEPGAALAARTAKWRRGRPLGAHLQLAEQFGVDPTGLDRSRLVDALSVAMAGLVIDGLA